MFSTNTHPTYTGDNWSCWELSPSEEVSSEFFLPSFGCTTCNGHFRMEQLLTYHAIHVFCSGTGTFELNGHPHTVRPGQMVICRPGDHARYFDTPADPWRYQWFILRGRRVSDVLAEAGITPDLSLLDGDWPNRFSKIFERIQYVYAAELVSPVRATAFAWETAAVLAENCTSLIKPQNDTVSGRAHSLMEQEYHLGLQIEEIADRLQVSRATLFRQFKKTYNLSPKVYLDSLRLEKAHGLLQRNRSTVKDVAEACGFQNGRYFSRAYKNRYGLSPCAMKKKDMR